MEYIYINRI